MIQYIPQFLHHALEHYGSIKELTAVFNDDETLGRAVRRYVALVDESGRQASDAEPEPSSITPPQA